VSRDAFSHDPQDTRDTSPRPSVRQRTSTPPDTRNDSNDGPESLARSEGSEHREQHPTRDERGDSPRTHYVRDRSYRLRESEMQSLKEIGRFRVIPVSDLAKYAYGGNRERMEKDIRGLARQSLLSTKPLQSRRKRPSEL